MTQLVLESPPTKADYVQGEALALAGLAVNADYAGSTATKRRTQPITVTAQMVSGYNPQTIGRQTVTVTVGESRVNFFVNVAAAPAAATTPTPTPTPAASGGAVYVITGTTPTFSAAKNGTPLSRTGTIQDVINAINSDANGEDCTIQFGNGNSQLDVGTVPTIIFTDMGIGRRWGHITLTGMLRGAVNNGSLLLVEGSGRISVTSSANITNPLRGGISFGGQTLTITGGGILANEENGIAVYTSSGTLNIQGGLIRGQIGVRSGGDVTNMTGGTIEAIESGIYIYNTDTRLNISGGSISGTGLGSSARAIYIERGDVVLSGNARITSTNVPGGTIMFSPVFASSNATLTISGNVTITNTANTGPRNLVFDPKDTNKSKIVDNRVNPAGGNLSN
jgi:hypothetical protein